MITGYLWKARYEQLRAAAEQARAFFDRRPRTDVPEADALRAALDSVTAKPVRETFDPHAVRELLEHIESFTDACDIKAELARAVRDSERK